MAGTLNENYKKHHKPILNPEKQKTKQGYFHPKHPEKYLGNPSLIIYRSGWEAGFCRFCDDSPTIKRWSSEPISIPYKNPIANLAECKKYNLDVNNPVNWPVHNYNIDFWCEVEKPDGTLEKIMIEIKPYAQTQPPQSPPPQKATLAQHKQYIRAAQTYLVNREKWRAAKKYCEDRGCSFQIWTERTLQKLGIL